MKKVVKAVECAGIVEVNTITDKSNVGIKWKNDRKSIIIKKNVDEFCGMDFNDLSVAHSWTKPSQQEYIVQALKQGSDVFVFESGEELLTWFTKVN
jgi:hypothetical protein